MLPTASTALTRKVWEPLDRFAYSLGEAHGAYALLSRLHWKVEFASGEEKVKIADLVLTVPEGPELITVSGSVASTTTVRELEAEEALPAASVALAV